MTVLSFAYHLQPDITMTKSQNRKKCGNLLLGDYSANKITGNAFFRIISNVIDKVNSISINYRVIATWYANQ